MAQVSNYYKKKNGLQDSASEVVVGSDTGRISNYYKKQMGMDDADYQGYNRDMLEGTPGSIYGATNPTAEGSGVNVSVGAEDPRAFLSGLRGRRTAPDFETAYEEERVYKDLKDSYTELTGLQTKVQQVEATGKQLEQEGAQLQQEYANVEKLLQAYEISGSSQNAEVYLLAAEAYNKRYAAFEQAWAQYEKDSTVFEQYNKAYGKYEKTAGKYLQEHPEVEWNEMSGQELHGLLYDTLQEIKNQKRAGTDTKALEERASKMESVLQSKLNQYSGSDLVQLQGMAQSQWQTRADNMGVWEKRYENKGRSIADDPDYDAYSDIFYYEQGKVRDLQERIKTAQQQKELEQDHGLWGNGFVNRLDLATKVGVHQSLADMSTLADKAQDIVVNGEVKLIELTAKMYGKSSPLYDSLMDMAEKMKTEAAKPSQDAVETQQYVDDLRREYQAGTGVIDGFILQQMESVSAMVMDMGMASMGGQMSGTIGTAKMPQSSTYLAMRATGGGIQHAQEQGYGEIEQILYGAAVGALEWGSEQLFGGNPLYDKGKGLIPKMVEKVTDNPRILRMLYSKPFGVLGEGFEEVFVEFTTPTAEYIFTSKDEIDWASPEEIATAFAGGVFLGLIGTGVEATTNAVGNAKITQEFNKLGDRVVQLNAVQGVIDRGLQADPITDAYQNAVKLQKKLDAGKTITAKDMGKQLMANLEAINAGKLVDIEEVEDDPTVPEGKLQDPEDGFYAVAVGKRGDKNTYRLVLVHSDGSVEQLTVEGTESLFGVKIAAEIQGMRVRHIGTVQNLVQIAEAKSEATEEVESEEIATEAAPRKGRSEEARKATERKGYESALRIVEQQSEERQAYLRSQYEKYKAEIEALEVGDVLYTADGDVAGNVVSAGEYGVTIVGEMLVERIPAGAFPSDTIVETLLEAGGYFEKNGTADTVSDMEEGSGLQWAGNAPAEEETADALEQLRQDYAEGKITDEEFDEAMEIIRQEESAAEESMVEGLQWAGSEIATTPVDMVDGTVTENNNIETEDMTYGEQQEQSSGRDGARIGKHSGRRAGEDRKRGRARAAQRRSVESTQVRADVKNLGVKPTSLEKLGLSIGSDLEANWEVPRAAWNESIQTAADYAAEHGLKFVPVVGNIYVKIGDKLLRVEAAIENGVIYVQADSMTRDVIEVTIHEIFHHRISGNKELQDRIVEYIQQNYDMEEVSELFDKYRKIYREFVKGMAPDKQAEYIWEEMLADAYAELERFPETEAIVLWSEYVREAMEQAEAKNTADGGVRMSAAVGHDTRGEYDTDAGYKEYDVESAVYEIRYHRADQSKDLVYIGTMPMLNRELFGLSGNVYVSNAHLYQNMVSKDEAIADGRWTKGVDYHGLGEEKVSNAIIQSQNPMVLMESLKDYESPRLVAIVEEKGKDGLPLIVVTELYANRLAYGEKQNRNHVLVTVYEKSQLPGYVKNTLEKGRVLHIKEGLSTDTLSSLQLAGNISEEVLKQNVAQFNKKIKAFKEKYKINYSMAGENALTADEASLQMAKDMLDMDVSMEEIRRITGWYQGRDGKWRFELDDSGMTYHRGGDAQFRKDHPEYARYRDLELAFIEGTITEEETAELRELHETWGREYARLSDRVDRGSATLGNILDHEELYAAYPELRSMRVMFKDLDGVRGEIDHQRGTITLDKSLRNAPESTLLHEIQHAIQNAEGFAGGSSPEYWQDRGYEDAAERYQNTAGEIEARDVSRRRALTAEERRQRMPDLGGEGTVFADQMDRNGQAIGRTTDNRPFVEVEDDILAGVPKADWVVTVKENLKKKFPNEIVVGRSEINIDGQSRKELTYSGYMQWLYNNDPTLYADKLRATDNADEILLATTDWVNEGLNHPRKDRIIDFARGSVLLRIGGNDYSAEVVVGTRKNGSMLLYDVLQLTPVSFIAKETDTATSTNPSPGTARSTASVSGNAAQELSRGVTVSGSLADTTSTASGDIISKDADGVNTRFSMTTEETDVLPAKAQSYLRRVERELVETIGTQMEIPFMQRRGGLREAVDRLAQEYLQNGDVSQQTVDELFDAASNGRYDSDANAREKLENAVHEALEDLRQIRRYADYRAEETAQAEPLTEEDVKQLYTELKTARNTAEKAAAKNLLTAEDEVQIGRLLRGEITVESLDAEQHNVKGIKAVYEARAEYERIAKQIRQWNQSRKAQLRQEADEYLQTANDWKDKSAGLLYARETMERNIRDIVKDPELAEQIIAAYFEPVHKGTAEANKLKDSYRGKVKELGLSRKVEKGNTVSEAHAVQLLGEAEDNIRILEKSRGRMKLRDGKTLDEWRGVVQALWESNPNMDEAKIRNAVEAFHKIYDELFERMNDVRIRNGYEPVNYRSGYFPHFQPGDGGIMALFGKALGIDTQVNALPTTINGLTHTFRPGITWFGNAQERLGFNTAYDAVEGFDKYIEGVADVIFHTDNIQRLRALASQIRYRTGDEGLRKQVDAVMADTTLSEQDKQNRIEKIYESGRYTLSNFVVELEEYTNLLANKKSRHDRSVEGDVGRKIYTIVKNLESRVAANMVAVNPASWLTNFIPLTQGGASLERGMLLRGMWNTLRAGKENDGLVDMSSFLTNRRGSDPIVKAWDAKVSGTLSSPMEYIDRFVADSLVRARYYQNLKHDMSEDAAIREADAWVAGVMADRSKGSMPTLFGRKNPMTKLLTQFQLEVNNQLSYVMKDIPRDMRDKGIAALIAALIKFCLGAFLFDEVYEYFIGRRPALDPLGILNDTVGDLTGYELPNLVEMGIGAIKGEKPDFTTEKKGVHGAVSGLLGNVAEEVPFVGGLLGGGRIPISSALPDGENLMNAAFNSEWDSEKRWRTAAKEIGGSAAYLVPPFGGGQIKKIVETVQAIHDHGSYNASGNLQYPVFSDSGVDWAGSAIVGSVFGKSSLPTAREWVESDFKGLDETYTQVYETLLQTGETDRKAWDVTKQLADAEKTEESSVATVRRQILREADISGDAKLAVYYAICANDDELVLIESLDEEDPQALYETLDDMRTADKNVDKMIALFKSDLGEESMLTALAYVSDTESEKLAAASDYVDCDLYGKFLQSYFREYGYEDRSQERVEDVLDHIPGLSDKERAALWQMSGKTWRPKNNPYSVAVGQKIYDALN